MIVFVNNNVMFGTTVTRSLSVPQCFAVHLYHYRAPSPKSTTGGKIGKSLLNYIGIEIDRYDFPIYDVINNDVHKCMGQPGRMICQISYNFALYNQVH